MNLYDKVWVPAGSPVPANARRINGIQFKPVKSVIVITVDDLLDLMQESIEYSYATLTREKAIDLLDAKLANQ